MLNNEIYEKAFVFPMLLCRNHAVNCEEMKLCKILSLNVKLKNDKRKFLPIMTVKWEEKVLKCDKREVRSSQ